MENRRLISDQKDDHTTLNFDHLNQISQDAKTIHKSKLMGTKIRKDSRSHSTKLSKRIIVELFTVCGSKFFQQNKAKKEASGKSVIYINQVSDHKDQQPQNGSC